MNNSQSSADDEPRQDELKQELDEELSQLVHRYHSRGLPSDEIVDSMVWHGELAVTRGGTLRERTRV